MQETETSDVPSAPSAVRQAFSWPVMRGSIVVAIIVGTILNGINQGDAFLAGGEVNWLKAILTYFVPFFVATYGAYNGCKQEGR